MPAFIFEFEETPVVMPNGETLYVTGALPIDYFWEDGWLPGQRGGYNYDVDADEIAVEGFTSAMDENERVRIAFPIDYRTKNAPFDQIIAANETRITDECSRNDEIEAERHADREQRYRESY